MNALDTCQICQHEVSRSHTAVLPCGHAFHRRCIREHVNNVSLTCPAWGCDFYIYPPADLPRSTLFERAVANTWIVVRTVFWISVIFGLMGFLGEDFALAARAPFLGAAAGFCAGIVALGFTDIENATGVAFFVGLLVTLEALHSTHQTRIKRYPDGTSPF